MIEIKVPELAESISEGTISQWVKKEGDPVREGDVLLELETDKVNLEINAEHAGVLKNILKREGDTVEVGEVIAILDEQGVAPEGDGGEPPTEASEAETAKGDVPDGRKEPTNGKGVAEGGEEEQKPDRPLASPAARKMARKKGVDLKRVEKRDPMGRITVQDVQAVAGDLPRQKDLPRQGPSKGTKDRALPADRPVERKRMSRRRLTIAKHLVEAQQNAAMLTTFNEVDMSAIMEIRRRRKDAFREKHDVGLGYMSFFTKAVVGALKAYPLLNAEIQGDEILIKKYYDIGIAVATDEGLVVPVVRNADRLSFAQIEKEIASLAEKARSNSLTLEDLQGGTFTITNGGVFGSLLSTPILNAPQVGILGMHKIQKRPVTVEDDRLEHRPMMYIALSYDHRIIDGKEAVSFLVKVKELLEDPELLLLEG